MLKNQKILFTVFTFLSFLFSISDLHAKTLCYKGAGPGTIEGLINKIFIEKTNTGYIIKKPQFSGELNIYHLDSSYFTIKWIRTNPSKKIDITAERKGEKILVTGKLENKDIDEKIKIDEKPWIQEWKTGFPNFIQSDEKKVVFWVLEPEKMSRGATTFQLEKKKSEELMIDGKKVEVVKTFFSLTNPLYRIFWKGMDMWFGKSEGFCVLEEDKKVQNILVKIEE